MEVKRDDPLRAVWLGCSRKLESKLEVTFAEEVMYLMACGMLGLRADPKPRLTNVMLHELYLDHAACMNKARLP